jgi:hypothetical protein
MLPMQTKQTANFAGDSGTSGAPARLLNEAESQPNPLNAPAVRGTPEYVLTRDPSIVESVRRNGLSDVIGLMREDGFALCYRWSVERYRREPELDCVRRDLR